MSVTQLQRVSHYFFKISKHGVRVLPPLTSEIAKLHIWFDENQFQNRILVVEIIFYGFHYCMQQQIIIFLHKIMTFTVKIIVSVHC